MLQRSYKVFSILIVLSLLVPAITLGAAPVESSTPSGIQDGPPPGFDTKTLRPAEVQPVAVGSVSNPRDQRHTFFVILEDPAVPGYTGGIQGLRPTSLSVTGANELDMNAPEVTAYANYLQTKQAGAMNLIQGVLNRTVTVRHQYSYALNGFALEMTADEAERIAGLPGVIKVEMDRAFRPNTDVSPEWVGATGVWDGSATGGVGTKGEGIIMGLIDTGINMDHPSFAALGEDGYQHTNPDPEGKYLGWCDPDNINYDADYECNDKLIGAWDYADASWGENDGPNDNNSHGSHTASTAAGNYIAEAVLYGPTTSYSDTISGMAPHANLIAYDACGDSCYDTDVVAAVNQAIQDGVDVINESIGVGGDAFTGSKQSAYLNAVSAGIFYARSAGNEGPNAATIGPEPPWTLSTAALTHNRKITNSLVDMSGGDNPPSDMVGEGFTAGYGPASIVYAGWFTETLKAGATEEDARLCAMGNPDDMDFETPWEEGTFNGEIVVCDRGLYPRVEKGANVLAVGAGGFVLADNGVGIVSDAHYLPGTHISLDDGIALKAWLDPNIEQFATISGYTLDYSAANGDIMAGFSSRGPGDQNFIKPDAGAPGVAIWAAYADNPGGPDEGSEFGFMGGTSMASPHIAGLAALVKAAHPDWTPAEIKSALMTTSTHANTVKEDGITPTDPFDTGAGRVRVDQAVQAGLLFDISPAEFAAANPNNADSLNLPSFANNKCFGSCSWTRTVTNALDHSETWQAVTDAPEGSILAVDPISFTLTAGASQVFTVTAIISDAPQEAWSFGSVSLLPEISETPDTYLPLAIYVSSSSNLTALRKEVDLSSVDVYGSLSYTLTVGNPSTSPVTYTLTDTIPMYANYLEGTAWGGLVYDSGKDAMAWQGSMDASVIDIQSVMSPQFNSLAGFGIEPFDFPSDMDEGGWIISGFDFWYLGNHYSEGIWSVNGTLEAGSESGQSTGWENLSIPNSSDPNNLLAPWWSDIDFNDGGTWYLGTLEDDGGNLYDVLEWDDAPRWGTSGSQTATFQIWIQRGTDMIWFEYNSIDTLWTTATVGVEDASGVAGDQVYFNGTGIKPTKQQDLFVTYSQPIPINMGFKVQVDGPSEGLVVNDVFMTDQDSKLFLSRTVTRINPFGELFIPLILK